MNQKFEREVGKRIREIRKEKGFTQEQLAARLQTNGCDITRSALAKIEAGQRHIYVDELKLLTELLHISYHDLLL